MIEYPPKAQKSHRRDQYLSRPCAAELAAVEGTASRGQEEDVVVGK